MLSLGKIVIVVQNDRLQVLVLSHAKRVEVGVVVDDAVLLQSFVHVEHATIVLPSVRVGVRVVLEIAVEYLMHGLFRAYLTTLICIPCFSFRFIKSIFTNIYHVYRSPSREISR